MFKDNLITILKDVDYYKQNKLTIDDYIDLRLNKSIENYYYDLMEAFNILINKKEINVMRKLVKEDKK